MQTARRKRISSDNKKRIRGVMCIANMIDFSCVEDTNTAIENIQAIASKAVKNVSERNVRLRLPGVRIENNNVLQINSNGTRTVIGTVKQRTSTIYKRGQVLHARTM